MAGSEVTPVGRGALLLCAVAAATLVVVEPAYAFQTSPCEGPEADPWVVDFRGRVLRYSDLAAFAVGEWGNPVACEGEIATEFDGVSYGVLTLTFSGGVTLTTETQPIETSVVTLHDPAGFEDPEAVVAALRSYVDGIGYSIDWDEPEREVEGDRTTETFWDPEPGLNASARLIRSGGRLVAVRFSSAL